MKMGHYEHLHQEPDPNLCGNAGSGSVNLFSCLNVYLTIFALVWSPTLIFSVAGGNSHHQGGGIKIK
jgi:hypothetical protein